MSHTSRDRESPKTTIGGLIASFTLALIALLTVLCFLWPEKVKPLSSSPPTASNDESPSENIDQVVMPTDEPDHVPKEKLDPSSNRGLGASLAKAPIPKPSTRRELPKDLSLGEHLIPLRGGEERLRLTLTLSSDDPNFSRFAGPLRGRLIEMVYFLVSHRVPEGMRSPSGEERLRKDLYSRFQNVLREQEFELYIDGFSLEVLDTSIDEE